MRCFCRASSGRMPRKACPAATARSTRSTAWTPPKVLLSCRVSSNIRGSDLGEAARLAKLGERHDPAREIDDDREQDGSLEDVAVVLQRTEQLGQRGKGRRAEDRADDEEDAADDRAERERRDGQVHAAEAEHGEPKRSSERRGRERPRGESEREWRAQVTAEQRGGVRADRHERGVPERELTGVEREPDRE